MRLVPGSSEEVRLLDDPIAVSSRDFMVVNFLRLDLLHKQAGGTMVTILEPDHQADAPVVDLSGNNDVPY